MSTEPVPVGELVIGGGAPVVVQSMTNTDPRDAPATLIQIRRLAAVGCELVRCAVPDREAVKALAEIVRESPIPVVADVHFQADLALRALAVGVPKIRINPGTLGSSADVRLVARATREAGATLRVGINAASLPGADRPGDSEDCVTRMVEAAEQALQQVWAADCRRVVLSLKSPRLHEFEAANRAFHRRHPEVPLHLGVTHAGPGMDGAIRSALGLGPLLRDGLGDTIRVSLTGDPVAEVRAAWTILRLLGLRRRGPEIIACPTCGRCKVDLEGMARAIQRALATCPTPLTVAVMGCWVNGPGEAGQADLAVACGTEGGLIFRSGEPWGRVTVDEIVPTLLDLATTFAPSGGESVDSD